MRNGWIKFDDEIPPLFLEVIILYPNASYNEILCYTRGKRVDDEIIKAGRCMKLKMFKTENMLTNPYAIRWAYDNGQALEVITFEDYLIEKRNGK